MSDDTNARSEYPLSEPDSPETSARRPGLLDYLPRAIALVVLAGISGYFVWAAHSGEGLAVLLTVIVGGSLGLLVGVIVGVPLFSTLATMVAFAGLFEGIVRGFTAYGWVGAVFGGPLGLGAGVVASFFPLMLLHFVLCLFGIDPFVDGPREAANKE